jgi:activating signal cointegrator complex subunit 1
VSRHMKGASNVSWLKSYEDSRTGLSHVQGEAGAALSSTLTSKPFPAAQTRSLISVCCLAPKRASLAHRRALQAMATPKYTNKKPPLTHFLCLPLLTTTSIPQLQESLSRFKQSVTHPNRPEIPASENAEATASITSVVIPDKAFRPLGVLHLTLGVMSLRSDEKMNDAKDFLEGLNLSDLLDESGRHLVDSSQGKGVSSAGNSAQPGPDSPPSEPVRTAATFLQTLKRAVTPPSLSRPKVSAEPLIVSLQGLQAFPKPRKATVLHCPPHDPTSRLYPFCQRLKQSFVDAGFMEPEDRPLVLHATIVNTVYAKKDRRHEKRRLGSITFDATEIMHAYNEKGGIEDGGATGEFVWANGIVIDRVRIFEMGAKIVEDATLEQEYAVLAEKMI